jgi:hypothetical protein
LVLPDSLASLEFIPESSLVCVFAGLAHFTSSLNDICLTITVLAIIALDVRALLLSDPACFEDISHTINTGDQSTTLPERVVAV